MKSKNQVPLTILEKLYVYGKHLLASTSGRIMLPCGLFAGDYKAGDSTTNNYLGLQRLYNLCFRMGCYEPLKTLFDRFFDNIDDYKKNSTRIFGCKGIFVPCIEAPESGLLGGTTPDIVLNYNAGSMIAGMMYKYYLMTGDREFLEKKAYEFIAEVGLFYEELFRVNKTTNVFENSIGYSCGDTASNIGIKDSDTCCVASNCAVDFASAKYVFDILERLALDLEKDEKEVEHYQKLKSLVPDFEVDKNGLLKEYNGKVFETNNNLPYIPHIYPYNIGFRPIEVKKNEFDSIVANTIKTRYLNSFSKFSSNELVDMALALSTAGDGKSSFEILSILIKNFMTDNLLFSYYDENGSGVGKTQSTVIRNIDKNTALCQTLQNLFITSANNNLYLFDTLPSALTKGSVYGLHLDMDIKADIEFNIRRGVVKLKLKAPQNMSTVLSLPAKTKRVKGIDPANVDLQNMMISNLSLPQNKVVYLKIYFAN